MNKTSFLILRVGLAITFIWVSVLIFRQPETWGSLIQPWALKLLPIPLVQIMMGTALLDMVIGILFFFGRTAWIAGLLGFLHLVTVLVATGINDITVRDIGLLAASLAVMITSLPPSVRNLFAKTRI